MSFLSRLLLAVLMSLPFLIAGGISALYPQQLQNWHKEEYEKLYRRAPLLKRLDPFQQMRHDASAVSMNRIIGVIVIGIGVVAFFVVLFEPQ